MSLFREDTVNDIIAPLNKLLNKLQAHSARKSEEQQQHAAAAIAAGEEAVRANTIAGNLLKVIGDDKFLGSYEQLVHDEVKDCPPYNELGKQSA